MKKNKNEDISELEREGWNAEKLIEESSGKESDEMIRQMLRGDESIGNPDDRDIVGSSQSIETEDDKEQADNSSEEEK